MPSRKLIFWLVAAVTVYLIAWNVGSGWLYILAAMLLAAPLLSVILVRASTRSLAATLASPPEAVQGDNLEVWLTVTNRSAFPRFLVRLDVDFAGKSRSVLVAALAGGASRQVGIDIPEVRRGIFPGAAITISNSAPFGIAGGRRRVSADSPLAVFPPVHLLGTDWAGGHGSTGYMVASTIPTRKAECDYLGVRGYRPEDSPRAIHWRTTARTGELAVVEYARQAAINPAIIVDSWREGAFGDGDESSFETAVSIAATLVGREAAHNRRFALGTSPADAAARGMGHDSQSCLLWLAGVQAESERPLDAQGSVLPWPGVTPVIIVSSHRHYHRLPRAALLDNFPQAVIIMLDWRGKEADAARRGLMMDDRQLDKLASLIENRGGRFELIDSPEQVERCLRVL